MSLHETDLRDAPASVDWTHLSRQTAGDTELAKELLTLFVGQARDIARRLAGAGDDKSRRDLAHTLKGSALAIGAFDVARAAETCETTLAKGEALRLDGLERALATTLATIATRLAQG
jgi:HPt (histidine-containing phosphotransfer) domain-containing protein